MRLSRKGMAIIMLLLGILVLGYMYSQTARNMVPGKADGAGGGGQQSAIQKTYEATCKINKVAIQQALQMYNISHEPMKVLDLNKLSAVMKIPAQAGSPCKYALDPKGNVVCTAHK